MYNVGTLVAKEGRGERTNLSRFEAVTSHGLLAVSPFTTLDGGIDRLLGCLLFLRMCIRLSLPIRFHPHPSHFVSSRLARSRLVSCPSVVGCTLQERISLQPPPDSLSNAF